MTEHALTPLCELARKYATDKGGWHLNGHDTCHNYTPIYYSLLAGWDIRNVLEIGVLYGQSLHMWREFFPKATIYGIDCNPNYMRHGEDRIRTAVADQNSGSSLNNALKEFEYPLFDLIVDDGSHEFEHIITSANYLIDSLHPDGIYVIEDMRYDCQPELFYPYLDKRWFPRPYYCGVGHGEKAHCDPGCPKCGGKAGETLLVLTRRY
jgi:hypothetical protein